MSHHHHEKKVSVNCFVVTISDTRELATDKSGDFIEQYVTEHGHKVVERRIIEDETDQITKVVEEGADRDDVDVVLMTGGTGISKRDVTIETVEELFAKEITGFGELFRMLSYTEDIGSAAIMSRATAGVVEDTAVFAMPGSSGAVKLAMEKLILPELAHIYFELRKHEE